MIRSKKIIIPAVALAVLVGVGTYGINNIYANESTHRNSIIEKIAQKFNLNKDDVQKIFDEEREARMAELNAKYESILDEAINQGKLTEVQKDLIIAKRAEIKAKLEANRDVAKNLDKTAMRDKMQTERAELKKWASDNGIDMKYLTGMGGFGKGGHGVPSGPRN